ncbi:hypothetical protein Tcan_05005 [Toxocara canis]|uniref:Membrane protein BRI3 n=1 Tax=Toxocara canis TaxID=6265 RepID=A0A0B2VWH9_TOXCA|nr:hypothetical protein Tcan_05005 [Toxocara canis]
MNEKVSDPVQSAPLPPKQSPTAPPPSYDDAASASKLPPSEPSQPQKLPPIVRGSEKVAPMTTSSSTEPTPHTLGTPAVLIQPPTQLVIVNGTDRVTQCPRCQNLTYEIGYPCSQLWLVIAGIIIFFPIGLLFLLCLEKKRICLKCETSF